MGWSFTNAVTNQTNTQEILKTYEQLKADLAKNDTTAVLNDYKALGGEKSDSVYLTQALDGVSTAFDQWTKSVTLGGGGILNNTGDGEGQTGPLGGDLLGEDGKAITLFDYLHNPTLKCHMNLPEFKYVYDDDRSIYEKGTLTIDGKTIPMTTATRDDDFFGILNGAYNGAFHWDDDPKAPHGTYRITATGTLTDFMKHTQPTFKSPTSNPAGDALDASFKKLGL